MWLTMANLLSVTAITDDPFRLSLLLVVLESSALVFEVPTGVIADSFSREWSIVIGYVIWGAGCFRWRHGPGQSVFRLVLQLLPGSYGVLL